MRGIPAQCSAANHDSLRLMNANFRLARRRNRPINNSVNSATHTVEGRHVHRQTRINDQVEVDRQRQDIPDLKKEKERETHTTQRKQEERKGIEKGGRRHACEETNSDKRKSSSKRLTVEEHYDGEGPETRPQRVPTTYCLRDDFSKHRD